MLSSAPPTCRASIHAAVFTTPSFECSSLPSVISLSLSLPFFCSCPLTALQQELSSNTPYASSLLTISRAQDNTCLEEMNVDQRVDAFVLECQKIANETRGNDIMLTMGTDFTYTNAWTW